VVKVLAEATLALVLFSYASRVGLRHLRADLGLCLRLLGIALPLTIGLGDLAGAGPARGDGHLDCPADRCGARADRRRSRRGHDGQPGGARPDPAVDQRRERPERRHRHAVDAAWAWLAASPDATAGSA
jgi:hypothetical protein